MPSLRAATAALCCLYCCSPQPLQASSRRLIAVGGGTAPPCMFEKLAQWAGGRKARVLVVPWATETEEREVCASVARRLEKVGVRQVECAPERLTLQKETKRFLNQLHRATAVYFTGGDQVRLMTAIRNQDLARAIRARYRRGAVVGGTSAGAAVLSATMLTGDGDFGVIDPKAVAVSEGLGLLTEAVVDQHFLARRRLNRLLSVLSGSRESLGIGIDEDTAVAIENEREATVLGDGKAVFLSLLDPDRFSLEVLPPGGRYDLVSRQRLTGGS